MGTIDINDNHNLGEIIKELNNDKVDKNSKMSNIDMNARLNNIEISSILALDSLVSMQFLPLKCLDFTRQKKRLSVSLGGEGRKEIVQIFNSNETGQNENKGNNYIKRLMGGNSE